MKISLNWIKNFTDIKLSNDELVERIGRQLGEIEDVTDIGEKYKGVLIAEVVKVDKHPDADKLSVCLIDDGGADKKVERVEDGSIQVVCGALNVREGMKVAWLPPGSTVPESFDKDPFVLDSRELRGVVSNGMLASAKELSIGNEHDGILEVDAPAKNGATFADTYEYTDDLIIDIENKMFTHRPDCFGILGIAREIAGIQNIEFTSPDWYEQSVKFDDATGLPLHIRNRVPTLAPRFMAVAIKDVEVKESPVIMRSYLSRVGMKPVNNIVDITNFMMQITAQPLHAFDYDKVAKLSDEEAAVIEIRKPNGVETLDLLNGKTVELAPSDIVIATPKKPIGIAGVMGGSDTEVDNATTNIILECANFDMYSIRRTSMHHGLFTDAVTRFTKGQSQLQIPAVTAQTMSMVQDLAGGKVSSLVLDKNADLPKLETITTTTQFINDRLGLELSADEIAQWLINVEFSVETDKDTLSITPPFWRTDIAIAEDIVEEVGRLYGYDKLPLAVIERRSFPAFRSELLAFKQHVRTILAAGGANELLTYSFVPESLLEAAGQNPEQAHKITNALSPDLQYFRMSTTPSLLNAVHQNIKAGFDEFALFEIAKTHNNFHMDEQESNLPHEIESVSLVLAAADKLERAASGSAFYRARKYADYLGEQLGLQLVYSPVPEDTNFPITKPYDLSRSALVSDQNSGEFVGMVGEFSPKVIRALKLPAYAAGFELSTEGLLKAASQVGSRYTPSSKYPSVEVDVTLQVDAAVNFNDVASDLYKAEADLLEHGIHVDRQPVSVYAPDDKKLNYSFRYVFLSYDRTLSTDEVNDTVEKLIGSLEIAATQV